MRRSRTEYGRVIATALLLIASTASVQSAQTASSPSLPTHQDISCGATSEWGSYFNGVLGGASLVLLVGMILMIPVVWRWKSEKKTHGMDE
jgi:hypothetical protein